MEIYGFLLKEDLSNVFNDIGIKIQSVNGEHQRWIRENDFIKKGE